MKTKRVLLLSLAALLLITGLLISCKKAPEYFERIITAFVQRRKLMNSLKCYYL